MTTPDHREIPALPCDEIGNFIEGLTTGLVPEPAPEKRPLVEWDSRCMIHVESRNASYSVVRYGRWLRKQACLVEHTDTCQRAIAYFRNEADAKQFAEDVLGGVRP